MSAHFLIYSSNPVSQLKEDDLLALLHTCQNQNFKHNITGILLCFNDMYLQLIEGEEEDVYYLYENIKKDTRHYNVNTLKEGVARERFFPDWNIAFDFVPSSREEGWVDICSPVSLRLLDILQFL